jgi:siderophore synthetase component
MDRLVSDGSKKSVILPIVCWSLFIVWVTFDAYEISAVNYTVFTKIFNEYLRENVVRFVKSRRISWIGHVERTEDSGMPKRVMRGKIYFRRKRSRHKVGWLDDVQADLREMRIEGWRRKTQDRDQWRRIAQEAKADEGL